MKEIEKQLIALNQKKEFLINLAAAFEELRMFETENQSDKSKNNNEDNNKTES